MSLLHAVADGLLAADRSLRRRRGGLAGAVLPTMPVGHNPRVDLVGENRTTTFAAVAEEHPVVNAVVYKLLRNLSTLGLGVYKRERGTGRLIRQWDTSLEQVLYEPAPGYGLVDLLQWLFLPVLVEGNSLIAKYRGDGDGEPPTNLLPLEWSMLSAFARPGGPIEHWMTSQAGEPRALAPDAVVHLAWRSPRLGALGSSVLRAVADTVAIDDAARRFQRASLGNAARPSGALVFPREVGEVDEKEKTALREEINLMHGGVDKAFRVALLSGGVDWKPMSFSADQAQLDSTRVRDREEICVAYDIRWSQIADPEGGARDVGALARDFHGTLRPWAALAESALKRQLIDTEDAWRDYLVRFDFRDLLRGSRQEELNAAVHARVNGVSTLDESRGWVDLDPFDTEESTQVLIPHAQLRPPDARALPPSPDDDSARADVERDRQ